MENMGIMDRLPEDKNYITISCKFNRIAVRRACLLLIGSPKYIFFMVNDNGKSAIIKPAIGNEKDAIRVTSSCYSRSSVFYFGGKVLIASIAAAMKWRRGSTYRVAGNLMENEMMFFDFSSGVESTNSAEDMEDIKDIKSEEDDTSYFWKDTGEEAIIQGTGNSARESLEPNDQSTGIMSFPMSQEYIIWVSSQMRKWGWSEEQIASWAEKVQTNENSEDNIYLSWRMGKVSQEEFLSHHKYFEQMDLAFELGRRVSMINRIRANMVSFTPHTIAVLYNERPNVCKEIMDTIRLHPKLSDLEIAERIHWN